MIGTVIVVRVFGSHHVGHLICGLSSHLSLCRGAGCDSSWAEKGAKGAEGVVLSDVTGICVFWDGSCRAFGCGAGMWVEVFAQALG